MVSAQQTDGNLLERAYLILLLQPCMYFGTGGVVLKQVYIYQYLVQIQVLREIIDTPSGQKKLRQYAAAHVPSSVYLGPRITKKTCHFTT